MWVLDDGIKQVELTCKPTGIGLVNPPEVSTVDIETDDTSIPRGDGVVMGQDFYGAQTVSFDLSLRPEGVATPADFLGQVREFWRDKTHRDAGGKVVELRAPNLRSAFGRPRRFSPDRDNEKHGIITVAADFECVSDLWFGEERVSTVTLVPPLGQGLEEPLVEPLTIAGAAVTGGALSVGGELPAWPVFTFRGPITNPSVWTPMWDLQLRVALAWDDVLVVDTRPWVRSMRLNGGPAAGLLMPGSSWLEDLSIPPGSYQAQLRGIDPTGTSQVEIAVRDAYASY